jgi:hypothetical protein
LTAHEKGLVEHLCGYVQRDLLVPSVLLEGDWPDLQAANAAARGWCAEVNAQVHSEIMAVPAERLLSERDVLRPLPSQRPPLRAAEQRRVDRRGSIRCGSGRYLVPKTLVGERVEVLAKAGQIVISHDGVEVVRHDPVGPGEVALGNLAEADRRPARGIRPRTPTEVAFVGLGPAAEAFVRSAAAAGTLRLESELAAIVELMAIWGREAISSALSRATRFRRFRAADVRAILEAGRGLPTPVRAGQQLPLDLPSVAVRPLSAYALRQQVLV